MESAAAATTPSSPGMAPVQLKDCIAELLKFTLVSYIDGTLGFDLGFSKQYCYQLLKQDDSTSANNISNPNFTDPSEGVPSYPLYKHLASALCQSISSGAFCSIGKTTLIFADKSPEQKEEEWNKLILEKGLDLVHMLKTLEFELHVQEPFFTQLKDGLKTVEGRCAVGNYERINSGALLLFNKCLVLLVQEVRRYASFREMLEAESIMDVLPGLKDIEEGVQIYRKFYSEEKERLNGVLAISVTKPSFQLYNAIATLLKGLSYEGVQWLLGLVHTEGTMTGTLSPPISSLLMQMHENDL